MPGGNELNAARFEGKHIAEITSKLIRKGDAVRIEAPRRRAGGESSTARNIVCF